MNNKLPFFLICLIVTALMLTPAVPAFAVPDYIASIPCTGAATLAPNESIVRIKGVANTLEFQVQPTTAAVNLSVSNWKINGALIFDNNGPTLAGADWGIFSRENGMKTLKWTLGGNKDGAFKITAVLKRTCGGAGPGGGIQPDEDLDLWSGTVIKVVFDPVVIKAGYTIPIPDIAMPEIKTVVIATVTPVEETNNIEVVPDVASISRVSVSIIGRDSVAGKITMEVIGKMPSGDINGDAKIIAKKAEAVVGSAMVVVIVPRFLQPPRIDSPIQFRGPVTGVNRALSRTSIPKDLGAEPGTVSLHTIYVVDIEVTVLDQFGNPVDSLYDDSPVLENNSYINKRLNAGKYNDPIGVTNYKKKEDGKTKYFTEAEGIVWEAAIERLPMPSFPLDELNIGRLQHSLNIGGHQIYPLIIERLFTSYPNGDPVGIPGQAEPDNRPNLLTIFW